MNYLITILLGGLISFLPLLVISIVGVVLSRNRLSHSHPRSSRFATFGFFSLLAYAFLNPGVRLLGSLYAAQAEDRVAVSVKIGYVSSTANLLLVAAVILFLLAILADRGSSRDASGPA